MAILYVGIGGFLGSCLRYGISVWLRPVGFPLGTLMANVLAGFLIGVLIGLDRQTDWVSAEMKLFLATGFLGGLSTFSTFSLETIDLMFAGKYAVALGSVLLNLVLSFLGVVLGMLLVRGVFIR